MRPLPIYSIDLIDMLNQDYPSKPPCLSDTEREVWFKAGQRALVESLIAMKKQSEKDVLKL